MITQFIIWFINDRSESSFSVQFPSPSGKRAMAINRFSSNGNLMDGATCWLTPKGVQLYIYHVDIITILFIIMTIRANFKINYFKYFILIFFSGGKDVIYWITFFFSCCIIILLWLMGDPVSGSSLSSSNVKEKLSFSDIKTKSLFAFVGRLT